MKYSRDREIFNNKISLDKVENWQACEKQEKSFNFKYSRIQGIYSIQDQ